MTGLYNLRAIRDKLRGMPARDIASEAALRAKRRLRRAVARAFDRPDSTYVGDAELTRALKNRSVAAAADFLREGARPHLTPGLADLPGTAHAFKQLFPAPVQELTRLATEILEHRVYVFDRQVNLGASIDWQADPSTGVRWPFLHYSRVPVRTQPGSDIRAVWELNRLHQFTTLGQAFALTRDERYAEGFVNQLTSWNETNPPRFGANWTVAMEAGIRAVNILAALDLFRTSSSLRDSVMALILKTLIAHGRFIRANLEVSHRITSNHYLSDLIGLFAIGVTLPILTEAGEWAEFSRTQLLAEMKKQVLPDGVDYEGTVGYHRFVLEILSLFFSLGRAAALELPREHWDLLHAMFEFVRYYLKPDGTAPSIGDSDDGRLLRFKIRPARDHYYLMPLAAALFDEGTFRPGARIDEETVWWFGNQVTQAAEKIPDSPLEPGSAGFDSSQIYIQRQGSLYAIVDCGDHGAHGFGSHAHSDALSIELFAFDRTFLRDPGTFAYTGREQWRDLFRSTAYHNTVRIDGREISLIREGQPFSLGPNVRPEVIRWEPSPERDVLEAAHHAYENLGEPVTHKRVLTFERRLGYWSLQDTFTGSGSHQLEVFFNLEPGVDISLLDKHRAIVCGDRSALAIIPNFTDEVEVEMAERWVSPAYGTRTISSAIIYRLQAVIPFDSTILLIPYRLGEGAKVKEIVAGKFGHEARGNSKSQA